MITCIAFSSFCTIVQIAITAQAAGENDPEGILLAGLRSGLIAIAIALLILLLQYPLQKLGFAILSGAEIESTGREYFNA